MMSGVDESRIRADRMPITFHPDRLDLPAWLDVDPASSSWSELTEAIVGADQRDEFGPQWASDQWNLLIGMDRARREWAESTVLLTFTTSPKTGGTWLAPVNHLDRLDRGASARNSALSRSLDGRKWKSTTVVGADQNGYGHLHTAIYVGARVDPGRFAPVVRAHVQNTPGADPDAHMIADTASHRGPHWSGGSAAVVHDRPDSSGGPSQLANYVGTNVPGLDCRGDETLGLEGASLSRKRLATALLASGSRPIR